MITQIALGGCVLLGAAMFAQNLLWQRDAARLETVKVELDQAHQVNESNLKQIALFQRAAEKASKAVAEERANADDRIAWYARKLEEVNSARNTDQDAPVAPVLRRALDGLRGGGEEAPRRAADPDPDSALRALELQAPTPD